MSFYIKKWCLTLYEKRRRTDIVKFENKSHILKFIYCGFAVPFPYKFNGFPFESLEENQGNTCP